MKWTFVFALLFTASTQLHARNLLPIVSRPGSQANLTIEVVSNARPVPLAQVWVESLNGKLITATATELDGKTTVSLSPETLAEKVNVTVTAAGYSIVSYLENVAPSITIEINRTTDDLFRELNGTLKGFVTPDDDSQAMVGLIAKSFEINDLSDFSASQFVSPLKDTIDVMGPREIPSNLVIPDQSIPVFFVPIHISKPTYRLPVKASTTSRYFGLTANVDVREAMQYAKEKNYWEIISLIEPKSVGISQPINAFPLAVGGIPLNLTADQKITGTSKFSAGKNKSTIENTRRLLLSLWEPTPELFVLTDVKQAANNFSVGHLAKATTRFLDACLTEDGSHFFGKWTTGKSLGDTALTTRVELKGADSEISMTGANPAQLVFARFETQKTSNIGSTQYEAVWSLVGPAKAKFRLPSQALRDLRDRTTGLSHFSLDLLQMQNQGYPVFIGDSIQRELVSFERIRTAL